MLLGLQIFFAIFGCFMVIKLVTKWFSSKKQDYELLSKYYAEKNWTFSRNGDNDHSIYPFQIQISMDKIDDLHRRLELTRYPVPSLNNAKFHFGMRDDYMKGLIDYWMNEYSWKKQEDWMNTYNHFKTNVEGLNVHFIHAKPDIVPATVKPQPILVIHGWPGSFVEYLEMIPMLVNPSAHGGNESDVFEVVCPSIPGYGFSDAPQKEGFNVYECARVFHLLMQRCGYKEYFVQGGDYGSLISVAIAQMYPSAVKGIHTSMGTTTPRGFSLFKTILGAYIPSLFFPRREVAALFPLKSFFKRVFVETGYFHLQATKPDTVGFALSDSPAGLAAYIIEKFSTWTDYAGVDSFNGLLSEHWTNDQLLNNVMVYWWNGNITSSMRFYKENFGNNLTHDMRSVMVSVPAGFAWFPNEFIGTSRMWLENKFSNLLHFTYMNKGGHFSAYEVPADLAADIRLFVRRTAVFFKTVTNKVYVHDNNKKKCTLYSNYNLKFREFQRKFKRLMKAAEYVDLDVRASQLDRFE